MKLFPQYMMMKDSTHLIEKHKLLLVGNGALELEKDLKESKDREKG